MLGGFETPTSGRIFIDGEDMTGVPPYERPVNMMFQSYALFPHMSVEQNVAFGLKQDRLAKAEIQERVATMLDLVKMAALRSANPISCPAASVSASRSPVRWSNAPNCCCWTSPWGARQEAA